MVLNSWMSTMCFPESLRDIKLHPTGFWCSLGFAASYVFENSLYDTYSESLLSSMSRAEESDRPKAKPWFHPSHEDHTYSRGWHAALRSQNAWLQFHLPLAKFMCLANWRTFLSFSFLILVEWIMVSAPRVLENEMRWCKESIWLASGDWHPICCYTVVFVIRIYLPLYCLLQFSTTLVLGTSGPGGGGWRCYGKRQSSRPLPWPLLLGSICCRYEKA